MEEERTACQTCTSWGGLSITVSNLLRILGTWTHKKMLKAFLCQYNSRSTKRPVCRTWNGKYHSMVFSNMKAMEFKWAKPEKKKKKVLETQQTYHGEISLFLLHGPSAVRLPFWGGSQIPLAKVDCPGKSCVVFSVTLVQNVFAEHWLKISRAVEDSPRAPQFRL